MQWFGNVLEFPLITPKSAIFGFTEIAANRQLINHILLIFKYFVYKARANKKLNLQSLLACINKIRNTENLISSKEPLQSKLFSGKWKPLLYSSQIKL